EKPDISAWLVFVRLLGERKSTSRYFLPLMVKWTRFDRSAVAANAIAAVRRGPREGSLIDAGSDQEFVALLLRVIHAGETVDNGTQRLEALPNSAFRQMPLPAAVKIIVPNREQSNTTVIVDDCCVVKMFRKVQEGSHPEIEIGRFLIEHTGFKNAPDLLGSVELVEGDRRSAVAIVHRFIENQGDAWTVTAAYLGRFIDDQRVLSAAAKPEESPELASYLRLLTQIGRRTGELQTRLAT